MAADGTAVVAWMSYMTTPLPASTWINESLQNGLVQWAESQPAPPTAVVGAGGQLLVGVSTGFYGLAEPGLFLANSTAGSRVLTVTSGSIVDVVKGMYLYSPDGTGDAAGTVMAVSGSDLTLDAPAPIGKTGGTYEPQGIIPPGSLALTASPSTVQVADWNYAIGRAPGDGTAAQNASGQGVGLFMVEFLASGTYELTATYTPSDANLYASVSTSSPLTVTVGS